MTEWRFPSNDFGEEKGINDSGIAQFRGTPLRSLAREICQNSLDAARGKTVTVEFDEFQIKPKQLPGAEDLRDAFKRCAEYWSSQKALTTKSFYANALRKIDADSVHMLRISDFNTSGLTGSHERINTHWTNLTKSSGVSDKNGTAGGSYGIGKFAPFACSDFSTVFYSTYDENNQEAFQGVSRLVTFTRSDGQNTQGVGYYGEERNTPAYQQLALEPGYKRNRGQYGTDIYIAGYKYADSSEGWEKSIIVSVLDSFLGAIWDEKLIVKIGQYEVSKANLQSIIDMFRDELTGQTAQYYEVLISPSTVWSEEDFMGLGSVKLGLLLGDSNMRRKIAMIRKTGMKIMDQKINSILQFAGIMFINGDKINERLRALENPEHTKWETDRADNVHQAKALLRAIKDFLNRKVEELSAQGSQEDFDVVGLGSLLPDNPEGSIDTAKTENVTNSTLNIEKKIPKKKAGQTAGSTTGGTEGMDFKAGGYTEGDSVLGYIHTKTSKKGKGHKDPYPTDPTDDGSSQVPVPKNIKPQKLRIICQNKNEGKYAVMFIPDSDCENAKICLELAAETTNYGAPIKAASAIGSGALQVKGNSIIGVNLKKDTPVRIMVTLDYTDYCSMEVKAYAD